MTLLASQSQEKMKEIKGMLSTSFDIKDMGELHYIFRCESPEKFYR